MFAQLLVLSGACRAGNTKRGHVLPSPGSGRERVSRWATALENPCAPKDGRSFDRGVPEDLRRLLGADLSRVRGRGGHFRLRLARFRIAVTGSAGGAGAVMNRGRSGLPGIQDEWNPFRILRERLLERIEQAIDELGPGRYARILGAFGTGAGDVQGDYAVAGGRLMKARLLRMAESDIDAMADLLDRAAGSAEVSAVLDEAGAIVDSIGDGHTTVSSLVGRLSSSLDNRGRGKRDRNFLVKTGRLLQALFFAAATGALGLVSVGVLVYGLSAQFAPFAAAGAAGAVACLAGIIHYVRDGLSAFGHGSVTVPAGGALR